MTVAAQAVCAYQSSRSEGRDLRLGHQGLHGRARAHRPGLRLQAALQDHARHATGRREDQRSTTESAPAQPQPPASTQRWPMTRSRPVPEVSSATISSATLRAQRRDREPQQRLARVLDAEHPGPARAQVVLEAAHGRDVDLDLAEVLQHPLDHARPRRGRPGSRRRTPAASRPVPSITPPNHREPTATTSVSSRPRSSSEHRRATRARWLAVVAGRLVAAVRPDDEGVAVVAGVPVLLAHLVDDAAGALLVAHPGEGAAESGAALLDLGDPVARDREVRRDRSRPDFTGDHGGLTRSDACGSSPCCRRPPRSSSTIGAGDDVVGVTFECDHPRRGPRAHASSRPARCPRDSTPRASTPS